MQPFPFPQSCLAVPGHSWRAFTHLLYPDHLPALGLVPWSRFSSRFRAESWARSFWVPLLLSKLCFVVRMFRCLTSAMKRQVFLNIHTKISAGFPFRKSTSSYCLLHPWGLLIFLWSWTVNLNHGSILKPAFLPWTFNEVLIDTVTGWGKLVFLITGSIGHLSGGKKKKNRDPCLTQ